MQTYKDGRLKNTHPFLTDTPVKLKEEGVSGVAETYVAMVHKAKREKDKVEEKVEEVRIFTLFITSS